MARIDDYNQALELAIEELSGRNPDLLASYAGAQPQGKGAGGDGFSLTFLNREVLVTWPRMNMNYRDTGEELPVQQKVLLAHYLRGAWETSGAPLSGRWIAYQEIPDGRFYLDAFLKRAKKPLVQGFGDRPELLRDLAGRVYGAKDFDHGDVSVVIQAFPLVPLALILWKGDDEFPPEGNILFDGNITGLLSAEDIAWLAGMAIYPLIGMARAER